MALHKSTDGGQIWTTHTLSTTPGRAYAVAVDPVDDNIIYVGGRFSTGQVDQGILLKTLDGGTSWTTLAPDISGTVYSIAVDPILSNNLYVGTSYGVYKSEDSGFSWMRSSYFFTKSIKINPSITNEVFAAGSDGVYFSDDGGITWEALNNDFILDRVNCFDMDVVNSILYAGTFGSIFRNRLLEQYMLALKAGSGGTTDPTPKGYIFDLDSGVVITAIPDTDWGFSQWSGDFPQGEETENTITVTMDSDKFITANFIQIRCTLTIDTENGGTTDPSPGTHKYDAETEITVRAIPDTDHNFSRWSGQVYPGQEFNNPLTLTMDSDKSITAHFTAPDEAEDSRCFIATAAYDSPLHPSVNILRDFRDKYLMPSKLGRVFVHLYYKYSPSLAKIISKHKPLKIIARTSLLPLVALSYVMLHFGLARSTALFVLIFALPLFFVRFSRRKERKKPVNQ